MKSNEDGIETIVEGISYTIGKTGKITPIAQLSPVEIKGSTIRRVTLNNCDYLEKMDVRPGDSVLIVKAGEIIPQIVKVLKNKRAADSVPFDIAKSLAYNNIATAYREGHWVCIDKKEQLQKQILHYAQTLKIGFLGPALIKKLVNEELVTSVFDLYKLTPEQLMLCENVGEKTSKKIINNIQVTKKCAFTDWLVACGIPQIGPQNGKLISNVVNSLEEFVNLVEQEELLINLLGKRTAKVLIESLVVNSEFLMLFSNFDFQFQIPTACATHETLLDKCFVLTGKLDSMSREEAQKRIIKLGGKISTRLTKKTDFVIIGSKPSEKKSYIAKLLKCKILLEDDFKLFLKKLEGSLG